MNERDPLHPQAGGAEVHCAEVFGRLARGGDHVTLISSRFPGAPARDKVDDIEVVRIGNRFTYYARVPWIYRRLRARTGCDVLVEDLNKFPFFARFWAAGPVLVIAHHFFGRTAFQQVAFPVAAATWAAEKLVPRLYRGVPVVAVSPSTREELVAGGLSAAAVRVIPNGLDHRRYRPAPERRGATPLVLALGRVEPYKRLDLVLEAMARVWRRKPTARLVIAGTGTALGRVSAQVAVRGWAERVEVRGAVSEQQKIGLLQSAHVLVTASEKEGWGITVLEAAACGTPAVATDVPGLRDSVRHDETGLLVPPHDADALAAAVLRLLGDDALRERLGRGARAWAAQFDWDDVAGRISAVIDEVAGRATGPSAEKRERWASGGEG